MVSLKTLLKNVFKKKNTNHIEPMIENLNSNKKRLSERKKSEKEIIENKKIFLEKKEDKENEVENKEETNSSYDDEKNIQVTKEEIEIDDEETSFIIAFEEEMKDNLEKEFSCLSPEEILLKQQEEIKSISDMFCISLSVAATLLRYFQWKKEKLVLEYLENPEKVCKKAGVSLDILEEKNINNISTQEVNCSICAEDIPIEKCTFLSCNHLFCNDCWKNYLIMKINEGEATKIKCPHLKCNLIVDEIIVKKLVPSEIYEKFIRFITKSFVEDSDGKVKWCPQPNCGNAITADMISGTIVKCSCGYKFCFSCHREAHLPAECSQIKAWELKCKDDTETTHWKYANTKDCPKCETAVEKNGGCNHMTCRQCKHEWCWVCTRPWKGHNDFYNCNKFLKSDKRKSILFGKYSKKDKYKEKELEREKNKLQLERYLHYYERYMNHKHSSELEKQIRNRAIKKMEELQKEAITTSEVQYILEGTEELIDCRNVLKYSYVFAYYLPETGPQKVLFEFLQEDLEKTTELLSEILETTSSTQSDRVKALNLIQLAKTRRINLLKSVEQGLNDS